jgi:hypothetical protein
MQGKITYLKAKETGTGKKYHTIKVSGDDTWYSCWNVTTQEFGDLIVYTTKKKGDFSNLEISSEVPSKDVNGDIQNKPKGLDSRDASIVAQNLINRATDRYIAELKESTFDIPEDADSAIKRHCEFYVNLYKETKDSL